MNKKKIAILFFGDCFFDARSINMAISLNQHFSVTIVSPFERIINNSYFETVQFYKINITTGGVARYWEYHQRVSGFLKNKNFDFIVSGDLYSLSSACLNKKNSKIIYDCREIYSSLSAHINKPVYRLFCHFYEKYFLKFVDNVVVTAKTDLIFLKNKYSKYSLLKWHIVYNYPFNFLISKSRNLRKQYSIPENHIIVLYQGVIHRGRGLSSLIKLTSIYSNITSVIIGDGVEKKKYITASESLNVSSRVVFISKVPYIQLLEYTCSCDIGWCVINDKSLSYRYALPNKLFEYLLAGLPVVSSPLINIKKIINSFDVGACVDYDDFNQQKEAIDSLMKNKKDISYYHKICSDFFTWELQKTDFLKIFS